MATTDYEKYIRTDELLSLQKAPEALTCHDEMQFQVTHQAAELWMKLCAFELRHMVEQLGGDQVTCATATLARVARIQRVLISHLDLLDTMSPKAYMTVRSGLGRGSGQESPGFRTLLRLPGELLWPALARYLARASLTLPDIYLDPTHHHDAYRLCEGYVDHDQLLQMWRYRHLMLVYRIIGAGTPSLKGKPSELLAHGMRQRFFPKLWEVRDELFAGADNGYHG